MSDSSRPHGLQPTRLLHPWDFPGKSTGVGCHCLLHLTTYLHVNATKLIVYLLLEALGTHFSEPTKCGSEDINCYNYQHIFDPLPTQRRESLLCCSLDPSRGLWAPDRSMALDNGFHGGSRSTTLSAPWETPVRFQTTSGRGAPSIKHTCTPLINR